MWCDNISNNVLTRYLVSVDENALNFKEKGLLNNVRSLLMSSRRPRQRLTRTRQMTRGSFCWRFVSHYLPTESFTNQVSDQEIKGRSPNESALGSGEPAKNVYD